MNALLYVPYIVLGGNVAILAALAFGLHHVLARSNWPVEERASVLQRTSLVLLAWFGAALALAWLGFFRGAADRIPTIELGVFVPIIIGTIALRRSETLSRIIDAIPQSWLVGVQLYRTLGLVFLILFAFGRLPGDFALPAGLGDVLVGALAPIIGFMYARGTENRERLVLAWNVFGILDLVVAVGTGFLTSPSPLQLLSLEAPNELISAFPLVMVPVFAVPISILLHLMSLMKLRRTRVHGTTLHSSVPARAY
jgi:hypothetical protein